MRIGILGAMHEEVASIWAAMTHQTETHDIGMRRYHVGELYGRECVVALSRMGKVAAASTTTTMLDRFGATEIVFAGVAGAAQGHLRMGDVVVGESLMQHDIDARPLFSRHEIPLLGLSTMPTDPSRRDQLSSAAQRFLASSAAARALDALGLENRAPSAVHVGAIASGDKFFSAHPDIVELLGRLPSTLCVEMEGAAAAQVCFEYGVPFSIFRVISDSANSEAPVDFAAFTREVAGVYTAGILRELFER